MVGQSKIETGTLEQKPEVLGPWLAKLRERLGGRPIAVGLEQSRGALIHALMAYDFLVLYPIHPTTVAKYREAFKSSGTKTTRWTPAKSWRFSPSTRIGCTASTPTRSKPACWGAWSKTAARPWICAPPISRPWALTSRSIIPKPWS